MHISENGIFDDQGRPLSVCGHTLTGRPFPPEAAEAEFTRLTRQGVTIIRFMLPWKTLEHEGPGLYDEDYLAYLRKICLAAEKTGLGVCICPRQEGWRPGDGTAVPGTGQPTVPAGEDSLREQYLACLRHGYRRLKNCKAIRVWSLLHEKSPVPTDTSFCAEFIGRMREVNPGILVLIEGAPEGEPLSLPTGDSLSAVWKSFAGCSG
ncbi:hypothetical protein FACS1894124_1330 [Spirochaetia bacterium]|nr:hypothetical protein FACS1894124_1330 [Spirochaetia bacterium]